MITRDYAPVVIRAVHTPTAESLRRLLCTRGDSAAVVVSDLSMGAWQDHQVSREWIDQLGIEMAPATPYIRRDAKSGQNWLNYGNVIGQGIEREAKGRMSIKAPLGAATTIVDHARSSAPIVFAIMAPRKGRRWGNDNEEFIRFVSQGLNGMKSELLVCVTDEDFAPAPSALWQWKLEGPKVSAAASPSESLASILPASANPAMLRVLEDIGVSCEWVELASGVLLVAPELRKSGAATSHYNTLAQSTAAPPWLRAYAQMHSDKDVVDEMFLLRQSWWMYMAGSYDLGLLLAKRAVDCAIDEVNQEICRTQLAGMQIGTYHFADAGAQPEPAEDTPPGLCGFLLMSKGWGLTMSGNAAEGTKYLEQACEMAKARSKTVEYKYLLNIFALSRARSGNFAHAKELELGIHDSLRRERVTDQRITYVNSINLARLSRWERQFDNSAAYYREAFDTTLGSRTEGERVYVNVCIGRLLDSQGNKDEAFLHWFRAALHFVSCQVPEAFSARYIQALVQNFGWHVNDAPGMVETICSKLWDELVAHAPSADLLVKIKQAEDDANAAPAFIQSEASEALALDRSGLIAIGGEGWSVLASDAATPIPFNGPRHRTLRRALATLIGHLGPVAGMTHRSYLIDSRSDREVAVTLPELMEVCLRQRIARLHFAGQRFDMSGPENAGLESGLRLELSGAVQGVSFEGDFATVSYKRFWPDRQVEDAFGLVRAAFEGGQTLRSLVGAVTDTEQMRQIIAAARKLEVDRVLCLEMPEFRDSPAEVRRPRQART